MNAGLEPLPDDIDALIPASIVARAEAAAARAQQSNDQALIAHLKLQIENLNCERDGRRSERTVRLLDQLELTLEELESSATEDELAAEMAMVRAAGGATTVGPRKRAPRKTFPEHLPREGLCRRAFGFKMIRKHVSRQGLALTFETHHQQSLGRALGTKNLSPAQPMGQLSRTSPSFTPSSMGTVSISSAASRR
jgi:hypothetical protein